MFIQKLNKKHKTTIFCSFTKTKFGEDEPIMNDPPKWDLVQLVQIYQTHQIQNSRGMFFFSVEGIASGQFITTSAEVTPNGGLVRESPLKWP